ncbi:hypothetical protein AHAS_Ahas02G0070500 [Arachis hypogaea]
MVGRDGDRSCGRGRGRGHGRGRKGRPRLSTSHPLDLHADPYSLVGSSPGMTAPTNGKPPPIATTTPSRQEPQIHMMPTPDAQGQGTSTATGHSSTSAPKLRYDGAKWFVICFKFYELSMHFKCQYILLYLLQLLWLCLIRYAYLLSFFSCYQS